MDHLTSNVSQVGKEIKSEAEKSYNTCQVIILHTLMCILFSRFTLNGFICSTLIKLVICVHMSSPGLCVLSDSEAKF